MKKLVEETRRIFKEKFGAEPQALAAAPGRLELMGNHTDYNDGYILSLAIDRYVVAAARKTKGAEASIYSAELNQTENFDVKNIKKNPEAKWANYPKSVVNQMEKHDLKVGAFQMAVHSSLPLGSGVSSSAAFLVSSALCLESLFGHEQEKMDLAVMCWTAERHFVGANNGLLDQFSSVFGKKGHALFLDCRTREHDAIKIASCDLMAAICQTNVQHSVAEGEYQIRRKECDAATEFFHSKNRSIAALRDVSGADLDRWGKELDPVLLRRVRHIVGENERVLKGKKLLAAGRLLEFGQLMYQSHKSSVNNFENSCEELDAMMEIARSVDGVWGARLSGGGFGGSVIALIKSSGAQDLREDIMEKYPKRTGKQPDVFFCKIADGARIVQ